MIRPALSAWLLSAHRRLRRLPLEYGSAVLAAGLALVPTLAGADDPYTQTVLHAFSFSNGDGAAPAAGLLKGSDGNFYGTTFNGGRHGFGTVFRLKPDGAYRVLYRFDPATDGSNPFASLIQGRDGLLYGSCAQGGGSDNSAGTLFSLSTGGSFSLLHRFEGPDGKYPTGRLLQAADGKFYGTTLYAGSSSGNVFRATAQGAVTTLKQFSGSAGTGPFEAGLVQAADGSFYGTTSGGGSAGKGSVFRIAPDGSYSTLYSFSGTDGSNPGQLSLGRNGRLLGSTSFGGSSNLGTVFSLSTTGVLSTLHSFSEADGPYPNGGVVEDADGNLYGNTSGYEVSFYHSTAVPGTVYRIAASGQFDVLHRFDHPDVDGNSPRGSLLLTDNGEIYGATEAGGPEDAGLIYKLTPSNLPATESIKTSPATQTKAFGKTAKVTAIVRDSAGNPAPGRTVNFDVDTLNPGSPSSTSTDTAGKAVFSLRCIAPVTNNVTASFIDIHGTTRAATATVICQRPPIP
jgi:uncharacterized repeat protein (TIGR03803 family)